MRLISISLDPRFDTPGVLKSYARGYGVDAPQSRFLTGPLQPVQDLKKQLLITNNTQLAMSKIYHIDLDYILIEKIVMRAVLAVVGYTCLL